MFEALVSSFRHKGLDFDHPDMDALKEQSLELGVNPLAVGAAFMVARDLETLGEVERLEGGSGTITNGLDPIEILETTFSTREESSGLIKKAVKHPFDIL